MPAVVTLLVSLYKITGPSFTRDESATLAAVHRSFPQLVSMLGHVDVVHGAYYALIWVVVQAGGSVSAPFNVYGLANSGTVTYSASVSGLNATGTVTLAPSGFVLVTPFGLGSDFSATAGGQQQDVQVQTALLGSWWNAMDRISCGWFVAG